jgi:hypothetical protein
MNNCLHGAPSLTAEEVERQWDVIAEVVKKTEEGQTIQGDAARLRHAETMSEFCVENFAWLTMDAVRFCYGRAAGAILIGGEGILAGARSTFHIGKMLENLLTDDDRDRIQERRDSRETRDIATDRGLVSAVSKRIPCSCLDHEAQRLRAQPKVQVCNTCKKADCSLMRCTKCMIALYCSKGCQREDWKIHKYACRQLCDEKSGKT